MRVLEPCRRSRRPRAPSVVRPLCVHCGCEASALTDSAEPCAESRGGLTHLGSWTNAVSNSITQRGNRSRTPPSLTLWSRRPSRSAEETSSCCTRAGASGSLVSATTSGHNRPPGGRRVSPRGRKSSTGPWANGVALLAADNFAVECLPPVPDSPIVGSAPNDQGMMHQEFVAKLGMPLGELWRLEELASRLRELNRLAVPSQYQAPQAFGATTQGVWEHKPGNRGRSWWAVPRPGCPHLSEALGAGSAQDASRWSRSADGEPGSAV